MDLELILYSQNDCDTCSELKEKLVDNKIYFEERNIHDTSQDNMLTKGKFLWEHKDLVSDLNLPPWIVMWNTIIIIKSTIIPIIHIIVPII